MDVRRLALWEGRYATYMSNDIFSTLIEDQGDVVLELTSRALSGARISALMLPYFRGTGSGVLSDGNGEWWQNRQELYQAGGAYFTFPSTSSDSITATNTFWTVRRYGTEEKHGGVWRLSEMKSSEAGNRYRLMKLDMLLPGHPVLYTAIRMENTGDMEITGAASWRSMISYPAMETGSVIRTNARSFTAYGMASRESGVSRFKPGVVFDELRHAPLMRGGNADAGYVPPPTGTYDYMVGKVSEKNKMSWIAVNNPKSQLIYFLVTPRIPLSENEYVFPNVDIVENYLGRMDAPWAIFDGACPQVMALTCGLTSGPKDSKSLILRPGEHKVIYLANAFQCYDNPRIGLGFSSVEFTDSGIVFKRTKSWAMIAFDYTFSALREQSERIFSSQLNPSE